MFIFILSWSEYQLQFLKFQVGLSSAGNYSCSTHQSNTATVTIIVVQGKIQNGGDVHVVIVVVDNDDVARVSAYVNLS